ncbi:hypothetical protein [Psychroserpens luteus]|uniref:Uncharacterized protein n=1 Tax=Psychroserpens luteus TaxID=1434066 RepID=A0ABW5ZXX3_9FLAO|nr:hypothetical protein [Psychroserpens luteus]
MKPLSYFIIVLLLVFNLNSCNSDTKTTTETAVKTTAPETPKKKRNETTRKTANVSIEAVVNGENFSLKTYNPEKSTDVVYLNNAVQFRITDFDGQSVMVNLLSPDMFKKKPLTISQQTAALPIKEVHGTKEQSKLSFDFKSNDPGTAKTYEMYDGELVVEEFSDTKIVITFNGRGFRYGSINKEANLFPMKGKLVTENFSINDFRMEVE